MGTCPLKVDAYAATILRNELSAGVLEDAGYCGQVVSNWH